MERTVGSSRPPPKWRIGHDRQHPPNDLTPTRGMGPLKPVSDGLRKAAPPKESDAKSSNTGPLWHKAKQGGGKCPGTPSRNSRKSAQPTWRPPEGENIEWFNTPTCSEEQNPHHQNRQHIRTS
jgi:hypothetical protein